MQDMKMLYADLSGEPQSQSKPAPVALKKGPAGRPMPFSHHFGGLAALQEAAPTKQKSKSPVRQQSKSPARVSQQAKSPARAPQVAKFSSGKSPIVKR